MRLQLPSVLWHCWLGGRKGIRPVKNGGWWRWALVSPDGVAPSLMAGLSASVNLPLHHKVQKFSSGTSSPGWSWKKGHKTVVLVVDCVSFCMGKLELNCNHLFSGLCEKVLDVERMATSVSDSAGVFFVPAFNGLQV